MKPRLDSLYYCLKLHSKEENKYNLVLFDTKSLPLMSNFFGSTAFLGWFHMCSLILIDTCNRYRKSCKFWVRKYSHLMYRASSSIINENLKWLVSGSLTWNYDDSNLNHGATLCFYQASSAKRHEVSCCGLLHIGWEIARPANWPTASRVEWKGYGFRFFFSNCYLQNAM